MTKADNFHASNIIIPKTIIEQIMIRTSRVVLEMWTIDYYLPSEVEALLDMLLV